MARPSDYCEEIAGAICERLAEGESLREICRADDMPAKGTVFRWLAKHQEFQDQYARAREVQADAIFDEVLEIADDASNDWMERSGEEGVGWQINGEHIQRSKLRIDARKWMAGKLRPKVYGDKQTHELQGPGGGPIAVEAVKYTVHDPKRNDD
ncbi:terminase small subunit protein [Ruegeria sp. 2205SS24-7]|uniref:terminase small subunit-like protein n=1 Tax=Ruegeria discodermiae TaxID=3064389 RepID=UPI002740FA18|nr:terminase small subunit protein [Ruegeria sp. 2205SS24-7]MDP5216704.1 terminase small subunit protein [Ruegeria sp. 2205SS24-7]